MSERLFRDAPIPDALDVFDVHVNALPDGVPPPPGLYKSVSVDTVLDPSAGADLASPGAPRIGGGCLSPPAGVDLLAASRRLASRVRQSDAGAQGWHALLRFDAGAGPLPSAGPRSALRALRQRVRGRDGAVAAAVLANPSLLDGFAGVKLMPQATGLPGEEVLALLSRRRTPLLVHAGLMCPPRWIERYLLPRVDGPVILAHLGSWPCSADDLAHAVALAERDERVHLETSGANIGNFLRFAAERVPEKLLFGSNRPMCPPAVQFAHVAASVPDDDVLRAVAGANARRLLVAASARNTRTPTLERGR